MDIKIRNINENDYIEIQSLIDKCGNFVTTYPLYTYWILSRYFNQNCNIAEYKNNIIGFMSVFPAVEKKILFIWQICVLHKYRNKGIASMLIDKLTHEAKKINYNIEFTISKKNIASINLFTKYSQQNHIKMVLKKEIKIGTSVELVYKFNVEESQV